MESGILGASIDEECCRCVGGVFVSRLVDEHGFVNASEYGEIGYVKGDADQGFISISLVIYVMSAESASPPSLCSVRRNGVDSHMSSCTQTYLQLCLILPTLHPLPS